MTFEEWFTEKKQEWNAVKLNKCQEIARAAWEAAHNEGYKDGVEDQGRYEDRMNNDF